MQSQRGFSVIEYILVVAVLGLIGGGVWFALEQRKEATKPSEPVVKTAQETTRCDKDWKEFSDPRTKASFCYPQDWKNTIKSDGDVQEGTIENPSGSLKLEYINEIAGIGGGPLCGTERPENSCVSTAVITAEPVAAAAEVSYVETVVSWDGVNAGGAKVFVAKFGLASTKDGFFAADGGSAGKAIPRTGANYPNNAFYMALTHDKLGGYFANDWAPGVVLSRSKTFTSYDAAVAYYKSEDVKTAKRILTSYKLP